ncbi:MAG: RDD family protein [Proteobacteria bacterium]|nr:RDD family protein [Pseudomonadota bacterium]
MSEWYYADRQGQQRGPVQSQELLALRNAGQIGMDTLVWRNGMSNWQAFATVANEVMPPPSETASPMQGTSMYEMATPVASTPVDAAPAPTPAAAAPVADGSYSMYAAATPVAQTSDPYAAPRAQVGSGSVHQGGHVVYAGFWKRFAAYIIDCFAIGIPVGILIGFAGAIFGVQSSFSRGLAGGNPGFTFLSYLLTGLVFAWFHSNASMMATPGKLAIGIKVTRSDGETISFLRGFARYWAYLILGIITLCIGLVIAGFTERKQALHDMVCDTIVVDKWAYTDHPEWQDDSLGTGTKIVLGLGIAVFGLAIVGIIAAVAIPILARH